MERRDNLYGRRKGKPLSAHRVALMAGLYPELALDLSAPSPSALHDIFPQPTDDIRLEIGFGGGEHLIASATAHPGTGFIGVEPFVNGMAKAVAAIDAGKLRNIRLYGHDAAGLLDWLPAGSLAAIDLLYSDPWPKRRHWKRRFVNPENLDRMARVLRPGGEFRFASDIDSYVTWTLLHLQVRADFIWTAEKADDWRRPWSRWPGTRYEMKAIREGRKPAYLAFKRL